MRLSDGRHLYTCTASFEYRPNDYAECTPHFIYDIVRNKDCLAFSIGQSVNTYNEHESSFSSYSPSSQKTNLKNESLQSENSKSQSDTRVKTGIDSPYRYDCNEWKCTPLDDYVWRDNKGVFN